MQDKIRITKIFKFETGHALNGYDGLCKNIHGHSFKLSVTVIGKPIEDLKSPKKGMVIDFSILKEIVKNQIVIPFDHSTVLNINSSHVEIANELEKRGHKIIKVDYQPTCELMIQDFAKKIKKNLPKNIKLFSLKLKETDSSFAEWYSSDNEL